MIINFPVTFTDLAENEPTLYRRQIDPDLKAKLEEKLPTFLKVLVVGAVRYYQEGGRLRMKAPRKVKEATDSYFEKQDVVKKFVNEECILGHTEEFFEECHSFFARFQSWCGDSGVDQKGFVFGLTQLGITSKRVRIRGTKNSKETRYLGIRIKPIELLEEGAPREEDENTVGGI